MFNNRLTKFLTTKFEKKAYIRNNVPKDEDDNHNYPRENVSEKVQALPLSEIIGMPIRELSPALLKKAQSELGEIPSRVPADIKAIKEWLAKQPHINANTGDQWILAFLRGCKFSLERTKEKIENYYTARTLTPEIFIGTDPADKKFLKFFRHGGCVALEKPISEDGVHVIIMRPGLFDAKKYPINLNMQVSYMITEILMLESDNMNIAGLKVISDTENMTMKHFSQFTPTIAKKLTTFGEKALPVRQKGAHNMNTPPGVESIVNLIKSFISEKHKSRLLVHNKNYEELYKHIAKACLPKEYGGDAGPFVNLIGYWEKKLLSYRNYFLAAQDLRTIESLRLGKPKTLEDMYGFVGSFRTLDID